MSVLRKVSLLFLIGLGLISSSGCAVIAQKLAYVQQNVAQRHQLKSEIHQARLQQAQAEKQHELDCIRAEFENCKATQQAQFQQRLKSQLSIDLAQQIQTSEIKIDREKLASMIQQAKLADDAAKEVWDAQHEERVQAYKLALQDYAKKLLAYETYQAQQASNCGQPAASDCCQPPPPCKPTLPVLHTEVLPVQQDLALQNLPLKMELRLNLGSSNSRIEQARVQTLPSERAMQCKTPCGNCGQCDRCTSVSGIQASPTGFMRDFPPPVPAIAEKDENDLLPLPRK